MKTHLIAMTMMLMASVSWSESFLFIESAATVDLPGFTTYTFLIDTDDGDVFRGVDAEVTGPLNQVELPGGVPSVFTDFNAFFPAVGADVSQDSQFLFSSGDVLAIGAEESDTLLKGAISGVASLGFTNPTPFMQIVTDMPGCVEYRFAFDVGGSEAVLFQGSVSLGPDECVPEPAAALIATLALVMFSAQRRPTM